MDPTKPSRREVEAQLVHMFGSRTFRDAPTSAKMLQYIVATTLDSSEQNIKEDPNLSEEVIGAKLFDREAKWAPLLDSIVRANAHNLRKCLEQYYKENDDAVVIAVPPRGYSALFSYGDRSNQERMCRHGHYLLGNADPIRAQMFFRSALPYPPAYVGSAETDLIFCLLKNVPFGFERRNQSDLSIALRRNPTLWQAHAAAGARFTLGREWRRAAYAFGRALKLDPVNAKESPWYVSYLLARGRIREATEIARQKVRRSTPSLHSPASLMLIWCLYLNREWDAAERASRFALESGDPFTLMVRACLCLAQDQKHLALENILRCEMSVRHWPLIKGLRILCLGLCHKKTAFRQELAEVRRLDSWSLALGEMARGDMDQAIEALKAAARSHAPIMLWADLLPLFDPMRQERKFKFLLRSLKSA